MKRILFTAVALLFAGSASALTIGVQVGTVQATSASQVGGTSTAVSGSLGNGIAGNTTSGSSLNESIAGGQVGNGGVTTFSATGGSTSGNTFGGSLGSAGQLSGSQHTQVGAGVATGLTGVLGVFITP